MKLIGKLQDGTEFLKKGHAEGEELFEFKTDEGNNNAKCFFFTFCFVLFAYSGTESMIVLDRGSD